MLRTRGYAVVLLCVAILVGAYLRVDQFTLQVLIDDEWHAVHQVLRHTPAQMFVDFGFADYSIPLGILDWYEARWFGLSETGMRIPMLVCGLLTLVAFPLYVARRFPASVAALFAVLLAISPLLVIYSRMARPYAITLLLGWVAQAAFQRYRDAPPRAGLGAGALYVGTAALAMWMHPIIGPFVLAPFAWALFELRSAPAGQRSRRFLRLVALALPTGIVTAALVLPPIIANLHSMADKSGVDSPNFGTLVGVWYAWLGTPSSIVVVACIAFAAAGSRSVWQSLPESRPALLGTLLTLAALFVARPIWIFNPIALARYLLPFAPLLLLAVAAGATRLARRIGTATLPRRALAATAFALPAGLLLIQSPLFELVRHPNLQTLHFRYHFDFRPEHNAYLPYMEAAPLSPFWSTLADRGAGSVKVAAAPFFFESYDWDAPRWERISRQPVIPGYLTGLCEEQRYGETPRDALYRFRNAVHLADDAELAARGIDFVVWQKPYDRIVDGQPVSRGAATVHCEAALRARFGTPFYEDDALIAFRLPSARTAGSDAAR
ncbi:MAG TPA: glycosyltransferase family 39 protein [Casimicrobiaceae bacterium]|nr:glycosyltransferase family 39 protein [Casimicrobiaceae bacterium]